MDGWVGRLVERLEELGLYDRTLIVFTSDHGEELAEHDPRNLYDKHGHSAYDEIVRVPLVVKLPQQRSAGTRVAALTRAIDVMPTVLDVVGVSSGRDEMQGRSLAPLWRGEEGTGERTAFIESAVTPAEIKSVRTETHKLVVETSKETVRAHSRNFIPRPPEQRMLFDLRADPGERHDLLTTPDPAALALADRMESELRAWLAAQESDTEEVDLDPETLQRLEALGYLDPDS
jgi:arylsulfatase A-like enzyme